MITASHEEGGGGISANHELLIIEKQSTSQVSHY